MLFFIIFKTGFLNWIQILTLFMEFNQFFLNDTALNVAAAANEKDIVEILLAQEGIDVNIKKIFKTKVIITFKSDFLFMIFEFIYY